MVPKIELEYENKFWNDAYEALPKISAVIDCLGKLRYDYVFSETTEYKDIASYSYDMLRSLEYRIEAVLKNIERKRLLRAVEEEKQAKIAPIA